MGGFDEPGVFTTLTPVQLVLAAEVGGDPVAVSQTVQGLVVHPYELDPATPSDRTAEQSLRPAAAILDALLSHDRAPLVETRPPERQVVGTCRHFAVLTCALLRHRGVAARARCGFASYFQPGKHLDHWVIEHWDQPRQRWVRLDAEHVGRVDAPADDLTTEHFLTGGEAWDRYRAGGLDPDTCGVLGTDHAWGVAEIRGNAIRDLAALRRLEMLPWDEWGRMADSYAGRTGPDYDELMDGVARACASDDPAQVERMYGTEDLAVAPGLLP